MLGEFLREAAVLIVVFGFLDEFVRDGGVTVGYSIAVLGLSGFSFMSGVVAELTRKE